LGGGRTIENRALAAAAGADKPGFASTGGISARNVDDFCFFFIIIEASCHCAASGGSMARGS
jgi:hypothetical protein